MSERRQSSDELVTIFGGSGFVGRQVVRALAKRGYRIRVGVRRPGRADGAVVDELTGHDSTLLLGS